MVRLGVGLLTVLSTSVACGPSASDPPGADASVAVAEVDVLDATGGHLGLTELSEQLFTDADDGTLLAAVVLEHTPTEDELTQAAGLWVLLAAAERNGELPEALVSQEFLEAVIAIGEQYPSVYGPSGGTATMRGGLVSSSDDFACDNSCTPSPEVLAGALKQAWTTVMVGLASSTVFEASFARFMLAWDTYGNSMSAVSLAMKESLSAADVATIVEMVAQGVAGTALLASAAGLAGTTVTAVGGVALVIAAVIGAFKLGWEIGSAYTLYSDCMEFKDDCCGSSPEGWCPCTPQCEESDWCGSDGCNGTCPCPAGEVCDDEFCCAPSCEGQECGGDGCGGDCGQCADGLTCSLGVCECTADDQCPDDGDLCNGTPKCDNGQCVTDELTAVICGPKEKCVTGVCDPGTGQCEYDPCCSEESDCGCESDTDCALFEDGDLCNGTLYCNVDNDCSVSPQSVLSWNCDAGQSCVPLTGECVDDGQQDCDCPPGQWCDAAGMCNDESVCPQEFTICCGCEFAPAQICNDGLAGTCTYAQQFCSAKCAGIGEEVDYTWCALTCNVGS